MIFGKTEVVLLWSGISQETKSPWFSAQQGWTPLDYVVKVGAWELIISRDVGSRGSGS